MDPDPNPDLGHEHFVKIYWFPEEKIEFSKIYFCFSEKNSKNLFFYIQTWALKAKYFWLQFSVDILPVDLHILSTKHCLEHTDISRTEDRKEIARHVSKVHGIEVDEEVG